MIGLSGGGWTTAVAAAIDTRIKLSIPVAGSAPLYIMESQPERRTPTVSKHTPQCMTSASQPRHRRRGGHLSGNYVLGGYGAGRRQIMVTNEYEPAGSFPVRGSPTLPSAASTLARSVKGLVTGAVANLGSGQWQQYYDTSQSSHEISPWTINNVILPAMAAPEPSTFVLAGPRAARVGPLCVAKPKATLFYRGKSAEALRLHAPYEWRCFAGKSVCCARSDCGKDLSDEAFANTLDGLDGVGAGGAGRARSLVRGSHARHHGAGLF